MLGLWRGQLSFYELCVYLAGLPGESATGRLLRNQPAEVEGWGLTEQLLGHLVDAVRAQWAEQQPDSCMPKALFDERPIQQETPQLQPNSAASALFGAPHEFVAAHGR